MKCKLVNISFIDGNSKNQRYCFFVMPLEDGSVVFLGFRDYNFKKEMSLNTFLFLCDEYIIRRPDYRIIYATKKFDFNIGDNDIYIFYGNGLNRPQSRC